MSRPHCDNKAASADGQDKPHYFRKHPEPGSLRASILSALISGRVLTSLDAWREFGASRLAAEIHSLREYGWPVEAEMIEVEARNGRTTRVAQYRLDLESV